MKSRRTCLTLSFLLLGILLPEAGKSQTAEKPETQVATSCEQPNILLVISDDQPLESMKYMDFMSGMDEVIRWDNFYHNFGLCCPSRASIMTGLYSHHTGVENNGEGYKLDASKTIFVSLKNAGYDTALIGKFLNGFPWNRGKKWTPPGIDETLVFAGKGYYHYRVFANGVIKKYGYGSRNYKTDVQADMAVDYIRSRGEDPFFLTWAPEAPHSPRTPANRHKGLFAGTNFSTPAINEASLADKPAWVQGLPLVDASKMTEKRRDVYRSLQAVDDGVRAMYKALKKEGKLDCTVIVYTTDNGFAFGEHRWVGKRCPYDACNQGPLWIRVPGQQSRHIATPVSNVDIAPTIAEMAGAKLLRNPDGSSLLPMIKGEKSKWRKGVLLRGHSYGDKAYDVYSQLKMDFDFWGVRTQKWKYIEYSSGEKELYHMSKDRFELNNLAQVEGKGYRKVKKALSRLIYKLK